LKLLKPHFPGFVGDAPIGRAPEALTHYEAQLSDLKDKIASAGIGT
jgi:hypothetical protein